MKRTDVDKLIDTVEGIPQPLTKKPDPSLGLMTGVRRDPLRPLPEPPRELDARQMIAISSLLTGKRVDVAAADAGVSPVTVYRWLKLPEFRDRLTIEENTLLSVVKNMLLMGAEKSVSAIFALVEGATNESVKLNAAVQSLTLLLKLKAVDDLAERMDAVERKITTLDIIPEDERRLVLERAKELLEENGFVTTDDGSMFYKAPDGKLYRVANEPEPEAEPEADKS